jgi:mono/diheme cytochrome c family protein
MDEKEKRNYLEQYQRQKEKGVYFFPDLLFKDAIVSLMVFLALVALAYFVGAPLEARADPTDTSYTPKPEWYFLFLFQLLKYFPGSLEVVGVIVLPTLVIALLFLLPFLDRRPQRHFLSRGLVIGASLVATVGVIGLTILAFLEAPPPTVAAQGDQTAALYTQNCAPCHGTSIHPLPDTNLHTLIAQGKHEGMPAWNADLTSDQIDSLVGFILSPTGSTLFTDRCGACHEAPELVAGDPLEIKNALEEGPQYPAHTAVDVPVWTEVMKPEELTALLNFLVAPDGQRLYTLNCAACHGSSVSFSGDESDLRNLISRGGLHLEMPPWREKLSASELDTLAQYVLDPASNPEAETLFGQLCGDCHGERIPTVDNLTQARETIASGGAHETMPVWGDILTPEQLDALVSYTLSTASGAPLSLGQQLFATNCATCHGNFGEGGYNPARQDDIIAPISSAEYLKTRDNTTLRSIIAQGQPDFGMSPFGTAYGGPLEDAEIDAIVTFIRSWEENPPFEQPPELPVKEVSQSGAEIFELLCAKCHDTDDKGLIGPSLGDPAFQAEYTDQEIFETISKGHPATAMIAWGEILSSNQINQLVSFIRELVPTETEASVGIPSFSKDVMPILASQCAICHGTLGGWDASSYDSVINSGDNAPVVIPGDSNGSLLGQKIQGTHTQGNIMPPSGKMSEREIAVILNWIATGALDN